MTKPVSEYIKLITTGATKARKRALTKEERADRRAEQARKNRIRQEARRRALMVLQHRHSEEYASLYESEQQFLTQDKK